MERGTVAGISERGQQALWAMIALAAVGLSATTLRLHQRSHAVGGTYGYRLVFASEQSGAYQLYSCDLSGGDVRPLLRSAAADVLPAAQPVSPGSSKPVGIAFLRLEQTLNTATGGDQGTEGGVYVQRAGEPLRKVSGAVTRVQPVAPAWSPDGLYLAFVGVEDLNGDWSFLGDEIGVYLWDSSSDRVRRLASVKVYGSQLQWSSNGKALIVTAKDPLDAAPSAWVLDAASGALTPIGPPGSITAACWMPDGQHTAAYSPGDRRIHVGDLDGELYALDGPSGHVVELRAVAKGARDDPSAATLIVVAAPEATQPDGQISVRSAAPGSEAWTRLTEGGVTALYLAPSPDGRFVAFTQLSVDQDDAQLDLGLTDLHSRQLLSTASSAVHGGFACWMVTDGR